MTETRTLGVAKSEHWRRDRDQFFHLTDLALEPLTEFSLVFGSPGSVVSRGAKTDRATYLVTFPAGWQQTEESNEATIEFFVLAGEVSLNGELAGPGCYVGLPQGCGTNRLSSERGATAILLRNPDVVLFPSQFTRARVGRSWEDPFAVSLPNAGDGTGANHVYFKSLRKPDFMGEYSGGPAGMFRVTTLLPGCKLSLQENHGQSWEGNILLAGDIWMAPERGVMGPGTVLSNPPEWWHGPMFSHGGAVCLVESDLPRQMGLREYPNCDRLAREYFDRTSWRVPPVHIELSKVTT